MKGFVFEILIYPYLMGMLLFTFHFFANDLLSTTKASLDIVSDSYSAIDLSNLLILNCTVDHIDCGTPSGKGNYFVRRLVVVDRNVKELIYSDVE